jgi:hypothetical protein
MIQGMLSPDLQKLLMGFSQSPKRVSVFKTGGVPPNVQELLDLRLLYCDADMKGTRVYVQISKAGMDWLKNGRVDPPVPFSTPIPAQDPRVDKYFDMAPPPVPPQKRAQPELDPTWGIF